MDQDCNQQQLPALQAFALTFSPSHFASGCPIDRTASRQVLAERITRQVTALTAQGAVDAFERASNRMVTACTRVQDDDEDGQLVQVHGLPCRLTRGEDAYEIHGPAGELVASAPQRFLAVARAATELRP